MRDFRQMSILFHILLIAVDFDTIKSEILLDCSWSYRRDAIFSMFLYLGEASSGFWIGKVISVSVSLAFSSFGCCSTMFSTAENMTMSKDVRTRWLARRPRAWALPEQIWVMVFFAYTVLVPVLSGSENHPYSGRLPKAHSWEYGIHQTWWALYAPCLSVAHFLAIDLPSRKVAHQMF